MTQGRLTNVTREVRPEDTKALRELLLKREVPFWEEYKIPDPGYVIFEVNAEDANRLKEYHKEVVRARTAENNALEGLKKRLRAMHWADAFDLLYDMVQSGELPRENFPAIVYGITRQVG